MKKFLTDSGKIERRFDASIPDMHKGNLEFKSWLPLFYHGNTY
jgi:hypothetical protein